LGYSKTKSPWLKISFKKRVDSFAILKSLLLEEVCDILDIVVHILS
jgi:hypothetical protein